MSFEEIMDTVQANTYKVVRSNYDVHPVGKLFILEDGASVLRLHPVDFRQDNAVFKLSVQSITDNGYALENDDIRLEAICHNFN